MIQSMTGYGKVSLLLPTKKISIEVKSLNSKNFDCNVRMPSIYKEKELPIRKIIAKAAVRGKIECTIYMEQNGSEVSASLNEEVLKVYMKQLDKLVPNNAIEHLKMAIRLPEALKTERENLDETEWQQIEKALKEVLNKFKAYRKAEGKSLAHDILQNITNIKNLLAKICELDKDRIALKKEQLKKALANLRQQVDESRFEQELIYYIEKFDINEEKVRLENHLNYFLQVVKEPQANGKKLGFISQEMGREINTMGSKANSAILQQIVVKMKDELEKIKEQLLNVL